MTSRYQAAYPDYTYDILYYNCLCKRIASLCRTMQYYIDVKCKYLKLYKV